MRVSPTTTSHALQAAIALGICACMTACKTPTSGAGEDKPKDVTEQKASSELDMDVEFLLSMSYEEAAAISTSKGEVPGIARVTADNIEVVKVGRSGDAQRLRATGHVYVEMDGAGDVATALSQEAFITEDEIILRGKPVLKRGNGLLEGLTDHTVFYVFDNQVRAIGRHRIKNGVIAPVPPEQSASILASMRGGVGVQMPKLPDAGPWRDGPNPLLPPLDDSAVPEDIRAEMRRQAEAEAVLQQSRRKPGDLPTGPLELPPATAPVPAPAPEPAPEKPAPQPTTPPPPPPPPAPAESKTE